MGSVVVVVFVEVTVVWGVDSLVELGVGCFVVLVLSVGLVAGGPVVVLDLVVVVVVVLSTSRKHVLQEMGQLKGIHSGFVRHSPFRAQNEHKSFVSRQFSGKTGTVGSVVIDVVLPRGVVLVGPKLVVVRLGVLEMGVGVLATVLGDGV